MGSNFGYGLPSSGASFDEVWAHFVNSIAGYEKLFLPKSKVAILIRTPVEYEKYY